MNQGRQEAPFSDEFLGVSVDMRRVPVQTPFFVCGIQNLEDIGSVRSLEFPRISLDMNHDGLARTLKRSSSDSILP